MTTHYQNLGIPELAQPAMIKAAYRRLCLACHPDRNPGDANASRRMQVINDAYEVLSDPVQRREYDGELKLTRARESEQRETRRARAPVKEPCRWQEADWPTPWRTSYYTSAPVYDGTPRRWTPKPWERDEAPRDPLKWWLRWPLTLVTAAAMICILLWMSWKNLPADAAGCGDTLSMAVVHLPWMFLHVPRFTLAFFLLGSRLLFVLARGDWGFWLEGSGNGTGRR